MISVSRHRQSYGTAQVEQADNSCTVTPVQPTSADRTAWEWRTALNLTSVIQTRLFHVGVARQPLLQLTQIAYFDVAKLSDFDPGVTVRIGQLELNEILGQYQEQFADRREPRLNDSLVLQVPVPVERVMTIGEEPSSE